MFILSCVTIWSRRSLPSFFFTFFFRSGGFERHNGRNVQSSNEKKKKNLFFLTHLFFSPLLNNPTINKSRGKWPFFFSLNYFDEEYRNKKKIIPDVFRSWEKKKNFFLFFVLEEKKNNKVRKGTGRIHTTPPFSLTFYPARKEKNCGRSCVCGKCVNLNLRVGHDFLGTRPATPRWDKRVFFFTYV